VSVCLCGGQRGFSYIIHIIYTSIYTHTHIKRIQDNHKTHMRKAHERHVERPDADRPVYYMCPHKLYICLPTIYVSLHYYSCVLILLYVCSYYCMCAHTSICVSLRMSILAYDTHTSLSTSVLGSRYSYAYVSLDKCARQSRRMIRILAYDMHTSRRIRLSRSVLGRSR